MLKALRHNWELKLLALVLALVVNFYVRREQNLTTVTLSAPVRVQAAPGQRLVEPPSNFRIVVHMQGPAELLREITPDVLIWEFDQSEAKPGERVNIPFSLSLPDPYRREVQLQWTPRTFPLRIVSDASKETEVIIRPINSPTRWQIEGQLQSVPPTVVVNGPARDVEQVAKVVAFVALPDSPQVNELVTLQARDAEGNALTGQVRLNPAQVTVVGEQTSALLEKRVPVQPEYRLPAGMRVRKVTLTPDRVRLRGDAASVRNVYYVPTEVFTIPRGQSVFNGQIEVPSPGEGIEVFPRNITVSVELEPMRR